MFNFFSRKYKHIVQLIDDVRFIKEFICHKYIGERIVHNVNINGEILYFEDSILSMAVKSIAREMNCGNEYDFSKIDFKEGDIVIDIGANVGIISIYLAKKYPFLKIYSFEPVKENFDSFQKNIVLNGIPENVITAVNCAVTKDARNVVMNINPYNSGGCSTQEVFATEYNYNTSNINVTSVTLENIFEKYSIKNLKLLKIDCEGSEYEILNNTPEQILHKIEYLRGEFHENKALTSEYDVDVLYDYCCKHIKNVSVVKARKCFVV